ncbi:MAG: KamA family radical SAM protein [Planctomycetes bacterium]|nr:KamA family radical SAM protein [Planctomycetota bacterium]
MFDNEERSGLYGHLTARQHECCTFDDEEPPGKPKRHPLWRKVPKRQWDDWRWQSQNAIRSVRQLRELLPFSPEELEAIGALEAEYKLAIPPYYFSLINCADPNDPIRLQSVTSPLEANSSFELEDPLDEDKDSPVPGITHRYPDRVLMVTTHVCTMYCRFCTRKRATMVRGGWDAISRNDERMIEYVRDHPQIRDVVVSGGDPLSLPTAKLKYFLHNLRDIPHVDVIRIGTRVPTTLPQKLYDPELLDILESAEKVWIQTHFNHPREITPEVARACKSLAMRGMPLNNHSVLLKGVNDDLATMRQLLRALLRIKVRPYYLFHCDPVIGAGHFRTSIWKGLEILEGLRGHMSGLAIPTYVVDSPHGGGKIPLMPNYMVSASDDCVILRNYEGMLVRYQAEDKPTTIRPTANRGVSQLIQGTQTAIVPKESERLERRRQYLQNKPAQAEPAGCSETRDEEDPTARRSRGRKLVASLPVVAE